MLLGKSMWSKKTSPQACRAEIVFSPKISGTNQFQSHLTGKAVITEASSARAKAPRITPNCCFLFDIIFYYCFLIVLFLGFGRVEVADPVQFPEPEPNFMRPFVLLPLHGHLSSHGQGFTEPVG